MDKPHATLSPLDHQGATHIKVDIANNDECKNLIRQVVDRKWSRTHNCWYVPYSAEAFRQLKELLEVEVPSTFPKPVKVNNPPAPVVPADPLAVDLIRIERENDQRVKAFVPWQRKE